MNEIAKGENAVNYEYKNVTAPHSMKAVYKDGYTNFGWEFCGTDFNATNPFSKGEVAIVLKFRRNRKVENRDELRNLEQQFDSIVQEIRKSEWKKAASEMGRTLGFGIIGTGFLTGAVFSFISGNIPLGIILLIPSLAGWGLGYFSYLRSQKNAPDKAAMKVDSQYEALYDLCEKGQVLLAASAT